MPPAHHLQPATLRTNHPALAAAAARTNAAAAGIAAVRTWEDPMLKVGAMAAEQMMRAEDVAECVMLAIDLPGRAIVEELIVRPR